MTLLTSAKCHCLTQYTGYDKKLHCTWVHCFVKQWQQQRQKWEEWKKNTMYIKGCAACTESEDRTTTATTTTHESFVCTSQQQQKSEDSTSWDNKECFHFQDYIFTYFLSSYSVVVSSLLIFFWTQQRKKRYNPNWSDSGKQQEYPHAPPAFVCQLKGNIGGVVDFLVCFIIRGNNIFLSYQPWVLGCVSVLSRIAYLSNTHTQMRNKGIKKYAK